jgi:iron complex transport system ATP-binding protein
MITANQLKYTIANKKIIDTISVNFLPGVCNLIIGPNGSGKSTLIKLLTGALDNYEGEIAYYGVDLKTYNKQSLASCRAVLSQQTELSFPMLVEEVVLLGRNPFFEFKPNKIDLEIVNEVIDLLDLNTFTKRNYQSLSGGEKQRVQYARVLTQIWDPPNGAARYLFLDEPLNNLDIYYQQLFLSIAVSLLNENTTLVGVVHDINIALRYAEQLYILKEGALVINDVPEKIVEGTLLNNVFNINTQIIFHPTTGKPIVVF